jgi:hypothetical protein
VGMQRDESPYGSQTLMGPGWPDIDEEALSSAAAAYEQLAMHLTGVVVPQLQGQATRMEGNWTGPAAVAALGEAGTIIGGHQINAAEASAIALKLRAMEASVTKTKAMVNATAQETQHACEMIEAAPIQNKEELLQSMIKFGQSQNMADVMEGTSELAANLGTPTVNPAAIPIPPGGDPGIGKATDAAQQAGGQGPQQLMGMMSQLGQMPQQLGKSLGGLGGGQGLQQLLQPLQQISSMFGKGGGGSGAEASPFAAFTNHPAAGGHGAGAGAGLGRGGSVPGAGGSSPRTPLMAKLVDRHTVVSPTAVEEGAAPAHTTIAGAAPVASGGAMGGMGGMGMMGHREAAGGSRAGLAVPTPLDHDLSEDDVDEDW